MIRSQPTMCKIYSRPVHNIFCTHHQEAVFSTPTVTTYYSDDEILEEFTPFLSTQGLIYTISDDD